MRPVQDEDSDEIRTGNVFGVQCFFGCANLECENGGSSATFGAWLPDEAIFAVRQWLDTVRFKKTAQASSF